jgi:hypothetical protein
LEANSIIAVGAVPRSSWPEWDRSPEAIQSTEWHICGPPCRFWEADLFQEQRDGIGSKGKRLREAPS